MFLRIRSGGGCWVWRRKGDVAALCMLCWAAKPIPFRSGAGRAVAPSASVLPGLAFGSFFGIQGSRARKGLYQGQSASGLRAKVTQTGNPPWLTPGWHTQHLLNTSSASPFPVWFILPPPPPGTAHCPWQEAAVILTAHSTWSSRFQCPAWILAALLPTSSQCAWFS